MKEKETIQRLVDNGMNNVEISKEIGCNRNAVRRRMLKYGIKRKVVKAHPNLKIDYFNIIDTKEKAYWLGFLYADGYINEKRGMLSLDLSKKDLCQIERFCNSVGANIDKIKNRKHKCGSESVSIRIFSRNFINNLVNIGCGSDKTKRLRLLELGSVELNLSFIMGLYDGDGYANDSTICSGGIEILEDIKLKYKIPFNIRENKSAFSLYIGADFKRRLMLNYKDSMKRKRAVYRGDKILKTKYGSDYTKFLERKKKFEINKEELEKLINENTYVSIGKMYGVSDNAIKKRARKLGIKLKPRKNNKIVP